MKSRMLVGLLAALIVLTLTPSSFAQVTVNLINTASAGETTTNRAGQTSDPNSPGGGVIIQGVITGTPTLTSTFLTVNFGAPINSGVPTASLSPQLAGNAGTTAVVGYDVPSNLEAIRITGASGIFSLITKINTINYSAGTIVLALPGTNNGNVLGQTALSSGSLILAGVRLDLSGKTAPMSVTASLSSSANNYIPGTMSQTIISAVGSGINSLAIGARSGQTNTGTSTIFTNRAVPDSAASLVMAESFASGWRTLSQTNTGGVSSSGVNSQATQIRLTFAGVPSGVTLSVGASTTTSLTVTLSNASITSTSLTTTATVTASDLTAVESLQLNIVASVSTTSTAALAAGNITAVATLVPIGDGLDSTTTTTTPAAPTISGGFPRFVQADTETVTVASIIAANTTMLVPYLLYDPAIAYDTGIAIANTTKDPGFSPGGAVATAGALTFSLYPRTATGAGTALTVTTSASQQITGSAGLSTDGTLASGGLFSVLLKDLYKAAGGAAGTSFYGYMFVQASFLNGHGISFITDFTKFTSFTPVLVLQPPATNSRSAPTNGAESLSF